MEGNFYRSEWKGLAMWQCIRCPWNIVEDRAAIEAHIRQVHGEEPHEGPSPAALLAEGRDEEAMAIIEGAAQAPPDEQGG